MERVQPAVGQWLDEWLDTSVRGKLRASTVRSYTGIVEMHLKPELGRQPKTERSRRTLQLPAIALAALAEQRKRQAGEGIASIYAFASKAGTPLEGPSVTHSFQRVLEKTGLPRQRFHDLRHPAATLLLEAGEELGVVSRLLGHADFSTTANIYAHLTSSMERRAADRMDEVLQVQAGLPK